MQLKEGWGESTQENFKGQGLELLEHLHFSVCKTVEGKRRERGRRLNITRLDI